MDDTKKDTIEINVLPYYVYELRDPRNNKVFYVGKGKNNRILHHQATEITKSESKDQDEVLDEKTTSEKQAFINNIINDCGRDVHRVIVGRFETETEALAAEALLIKWVYGIENLTNRIHGHRHKNIREHRQQVEMQERIQDDNSRYPEEPGLDIPKKLPGARDMSGKYTDDQLRKISENAIFEKLEALRDELCVVEDLQGLTISDPDISKPQDPCLIISGFEPMTIQLMIRMQLSGNTVYLVLIPNGTTKEAQQAFRNALSSTSFASLSINNGTRYKLYVRTHPKGEEMPHAEIAEIVKEIKLVLDKLHQ